MGLVYLSPVARCNRASWILHHAHPMTEKGFAGVYGTCNTFYSLQNFLFQSLGIFFCASSLVSGLGFALCSNFGLHVAVFMVLSAVYDGTFSPVWFVCFPFV